MPHVTVTYEMFLPSGHHRQPRNTSVELNLDGTGGGDYLPGGVCSPNFFPQLPYTLGMGTGTAQLIFWSATDGMSGEVRPPTVQSFTVGANPMTITAWYFPISGPGVGDGGPEIIDDAFSANAGTFIDDTFVDVPSDPSLTSDANVIGVVPTNDAETLVAHNNVVSTAEPFFKWILNGSFGPVGDTTLQVPKDTVGIAIAVYQDHHRPTVIPPYEVAYNRWWWIETHGGLVPPGPSDPWTRELGAAIVLGNIAKSVAPQLRGAVMEAALVQAKFAAANLEKQLKGLQGQ